MALIGTMKYLTIGNQTYEIAGDELQIASASTLGGIKVGSGLSIDATTGVLSTSITESDPVFSASAAAGITATDISNWNAKPSTDEKVAQIPITSSFNAEKSLVLGDTLATLGGNTTTNSVNTSPYLTYKYPSNYLYIKQSNGKSLAIYPLGLQWYDGTNKSYLTASSVTSGRSWSLPDKTGTIALTSDIPSISLNGSSTTSASFYAPTTAGTSGYYLKSNGSGAPTWAAISDKIFIAEYNSTTYADILAAYNAGKTIILKEVYSSATTYYAYLEKYTDNTFYFATPIDENNNIKAIYTYTIGSSISSDGSVYLDIPSISLNGISTTSASFYAPTSAGTSGQVLTSNGSGAPTWAPATGGTDEKLALSEVTAGTTYYPIMGTGTTAATRQYDTGGLSYINGGGVKTLSIGDNTSNNNVGALDIYSLTSSRVRLVANTSLSSNVLVYLPSTAGTIALTSDVTKAQIIRWTES